MRKLTLGLNTAKNTNYIGKCFKQKLHRIKFPIKNLKHAYLYLPQEWSKRALPFLKYYNAWEWKGRFTLGLNIAKNIDFNEKCFKQKLHVIKFSTKNKADKYLYLSQQWS